MGTKRQCGGLVPLSLVWDASTLLALTWMPIVVNVPVVALWPCRMATLCYRRGCLPLSKWDMAKEPPEREIIACLDHTGQEKGQP
jgi:hypothetical protein